MYFCCYNLATNANNNLKAKPVCACVFVLRVFLSFHFHYYKFLRYFYWNWIVGASCTLDSPFQSCSFFVCFAVNDSAHSIHIHSTLNSVSLTVQCKCICQLCVCSAVRVDSPSLGLKLADRLSLGKIAKSAQTRSNSCVSVPKRLVQIECNLIGIVKQAHTRMYVLRGLYSTIQSNMAITMWSSL